MFPIDQSLQEMNNAEYGFSEQMSLLIQDDNMMIGTELLDMGLVGMNVLEGENNNNNNNNNNHFQFTDEYSIHRQIMRNEVENNETQMAIQNSMILMNGGQIKDNNVYVDQPLQGQGGDHEATTFNAQLGNQYNLFPFQMTGQNLETSHGAHVASEFNILPFQDQAFNNIPFQVTGGNSLNGVVEENNFENNILYAGGQLGNDTNNNNHHQLSNGANAFNLSPMPELMMVLRDEDWESQPDDEIHEPSNMSPAQPSNPNQKPKGKKYNRHTAKQIEELEGLFKDHPHPTDRQRKVLANRLGMNPLQVKFWFQNRRTQAKTMQERHDNNKLRQKMEALQMENLRLKDALSTASCIQCGGSSVTSDATVEEQKLRLEISRLRSEIERLTTLATKCIGQPVPNVVDNVSAPPLNGSMVDYFRLLTPPNEAETQMLMDLAVIGTEEIMMLTRIDEPLWKLNLDGTFSLNEDEYINTFPIHNRTKPTAFKFKATRECVVVLMSHVTVVEMLMNTNQWCNMFTSIVSRVTSLSVPTPGYSGYYDGTLQLMTAEYHVPSPLVPMHKSYFLRFSKRHPTGIWTVVDVSLDHLRSDVPTKYHRRPSGCLIQELPEGYAKITWVEHVGLESSAIHNLYKPIFSTGLAFGAKRWASILYQQCERRVATAATANLSTDFNHMVMIDPKAGRKTLLKLGERLVKGFYQGLRASHTERWMSVPGSVSADFKIMSHTNVNDQGRPLGVAVIATTSIWLPVSPKKMFGYLQNENIRRSWDVLSGAINLKEVTHVASSGQPGDFVSLLGQTVPTVGVNKNMMVLQETFYDPLSSYLVYAPIDITVLNMAFSGALTPECVALLPSGFAIMPDGPLVNRGEEEGLGSSGSLLTIALQILVNTVPKYNVPSRDIDAINSLMTRSVDSIKAMVARNDD